MKGLVKLAGSFARSNTSPNRRYHSPRLSPPIARSPRDFRRSFFVPGSPSIESECLRFADTVVPSDELEPERRVRSPRRPRFAVKGCAVAAARPGSRGGVRPARCSAGLRVTVVPGHPPRRFGGAGPRGPAVLGGCGAEPREERNCNPGASRTCLVNVLETVTLFN